MPKKRDQEFYSEKEAKRRFEAALRGAALARTEKPTTKVQKKKKPKRSSSST